MDCVIHKYAKTVEDIKRLEKVIGLSKANTARQFVEERIFNEGKAEGLSEGRAEGLSEGQLLMAIKLAGKLGVDVIVDASGFSREELSKK